MVASDSTMNLGVVMSNFAPGDFFVGYGTGIRSVGGGGIGNLAEIAPEWHVVPFQVLVHHRYHADGKVARDAAADLEKAHPFTAAVFAVPVRQPHHVLDAAFYGRGLQFAFDDVVGEDVARGAVFPTGNHDGYAFCAAATIHLCSGVDFVVLLQLAAQHHLVQKLVREIALAGSFGIFPHFYQWACNRRKASSSGMQVSVTRL